METTTLIAGGAFLISAITVVMTFFSNRSKALKSEFDVLVESLRRTKEQVMSLEKKLEQASVLIAQLREENIILLRKVVGVENNLQERFQ